MLMTKCVTIILLLCKLKIETASVCDSRPKGAIGQPQISGNKYRIVIALNPEKYNPGQTYNVTLQGQSSLANNETNMFNGFTLTVEPMEKPVNSVQNWGPLAAGILKILPDEVNAKIDENCPNTVVHTSHVFVTKIDMQWTAPYPGIGCIRFKAAVMEQNLWFKNDSGLMLVLCENNRFEGVLTNEKCCSCNEAKYEMRFEGMWTRQSHPLFFPDNVWLTRFSDVIGASHASDYRIWKTNENASEGLIEFSEGENTTKLELEIKSNATRTVIKAKGVSYPNITGKTFAVFRVDPHHHLLSLISLIKPSPDWFVGISGLELCNSTCQWVSQYVFDLYPYDLGLYEDVKYESKTKPYREPIHEIDHSDIAESPFYTKGTEKLKPMAKLYLTKSREYEKDDKNCLANMQTNEQYTNRVSSYDAGIAVGGARTDDISNVPNELPADAMIRECQNSKFGSWSNCSIRTCDPERVRIQVQQFPVSIREYCKSQNVSEEVRVRPCPEECPQGIDYGSTKDCKVTKWGPFSECQGDACTRKRERSARDKQSRHCAKIIYNQEIKCASEECAQERNKGNFATTNEYPS